MDDNKDIEKPDYSDEELKYRHERIEEMSNARLQLWNTWIEFDGMNYYDWYETNAKAANSYIPPKQNKQDTRIVTGVTHEKTITMLSALLNYNYQPNIVAYDESDEEVYELGERMELLIKKSNDIERPTYEEKRGLIYKEALDQGDAFIEDVYEQHEMIEKEKATFNLQDMKMNQRWKETGRKLHSQLSTNLIAGPNFYPGNIREFYMTKQPFIFTRRLETRARAEAMFGNLPRWKNVPKDVEWFDATQVQDVLYRNWTIEPLRKNMVEILVYQNKWTNEFMIWCNGVMMLPLGYPLTALNGKCEYTVIKLSVEPISEFFFYSKSIPAKTKVDQAIYDEMYRLMILKFRQSVMPPMINNTGKQIGESVFYPARITDDIEAGSLTPLMPTAQGITNSEFNIIQFVKSVLDDKSVSPTFEGQQTPGQQTAREIVELQKNQMMKLGLTIMGVVSYEMNRSYLRLYNILRYWTQREDTELDEIKGKLKDVYKKIEVEGPVGDGMEGTNIMQFMGPDQELPDSDQVLAEENLMSKRSGRKFRKTYLDAEALREAELKWKIIIEPTPKDTDALSRAQYEESLQTSLAVFGELNNMDYQAKEFSKHAKWDYEKAFKKPQPAMPQGMPGGQPQGAPQGMPQGIPGMGQAAAPTMPKPSINTLMGK